MPDYAQTNASLLQAIFHAMNTDFYHSYDSDHRPAIFKDTENPSIYMTFTDKPGNPPSQQVVAGFIETLKPALNDLNITTAMLPSTFRDFPIDPDVHTAATIDVEFSGKSIASKSFNELLMHELNKRMERAHALDTSGVVELT